MPKSTPRPKAPLRTGIGKYPEVPMTYRLRNCLMNAQLTFEQAASKPERELLKIKNFGEVCLRELDDLLEERGLPRHRPLWAHQSKRKASKPIYCLMRSYGYGEISWEDIPANAPIPKVGDESNEYEYLHHFEGGVVIALIEKESPEGEMLALVEYLDKLARAEWSSEAVWLKLAALLTKAAQGCDATIAKRAEVRKYFLECEART